MAREVLTYTVTMRIFVTGGTGFVGSPLVRLLRERGHDVSLLSGRLSEVDAVAKQIDSCDPKAIVHLAWEGLPDYGETMSSKNAAESSAFFDLLARIGIKKIVATGSCWQYKVREGERRESDEMADADFFTAAKNAVMAHGISLAKENCSFVWAVPFFIYGPGQREQSLVPSLIAQARRGETPTPRSVAWNDMIYVDDVAQGLAALTEENVPTGIYNIGSGTLTGTYDVAREIASRFDVPAPAAPDKRPVGMYANISKITKVTRWRPVTSLRSGIMQTI